MRQFAELERKMRSFCYAFAGIASFSIVVVTCATLSPCRAQSPIELPGAHLVPFEKRQIMIDLKCPNEKREPLEYTAQFGRGINTQVTTYNLSKSKWHIKVATGESHTVWFEADVEAVGSELVVTSIVSSRPSRDGFAQALHAHADRLVREVCNAPAAERKRYFDLIHENIEISAKRFKDN
jgi:hypothetical protein